MLKIRGSFLGMVGNLGSDDSCVRSSRYHDRFLSSEILIELLPLVSFVKVAEHCLLLESTSNNYEIAIDCEMIFDPP